jgi:curved DNA-binding protein
VEADLAVTFEEALRGSRRQLSLRRPEATRAETYLVRIPAGVREGQRIRLAGQGSPGEDGAGSGDLLLRVRLARHPDFVADGDDLIHELDLAPWEAALGARIRIPTLGGEAWVRVPAGANDGLRLRLSGQGLPIDALKRGDLFAVVRLRVPSVMTPEERSLWENLARVATFHPRAVSTETQT